MEGVTGSIPVAPTRYPLEILAFTSAADAVLDLMIRSAAISPCGRYRWWLKREWGDGPVIAWIMLNPARADDTRDDPTIRRVIHFSRSWGFATATVVNLYPFRSTRPVECRDWARSSAVEIAKRMRENDRVIADVAQSAGALLAAWGTVHWAHGRAAGLAAALSRRGGAPLSCLGLTADGSPIHPLARGRSRVPDHAMQMAWTQPIAAATGGVKA